MSERPKRVPDLLLEQLLLGELSSDQELSLRASMEPAELERRLAALKAENDAFAVRLAADETVASIRDRVRVEKARRDQTPRSTWRIALPVVAALGLALLVFRGQPPVEGPAVEGPDTTRVKGLAPHLVLYRRRGSDVEMLSEGARASRGDMLQVGYVAADARYGAILSIDGRGAVTLHYPSEEYGTTLLEATGEHLLDHAYELDAAPAFERFFFVTDTRPVDVKRVLAAARMLSRSPELARRAPLALTSSIKQESLTLVKE